MNRVSCLLLIAIRFLLANDIQNVQTPITPQLSEELSRTNSESFIRINIVMKEQIDSDILYSNVQGLSKANRRQFVINELKYFAQNTQGDILNQLSTLENTGQVKDVTSLWITNVINCYATPEAIKTLSSRSDVHRIDHDEKRKMLIDTPQDMAAISNSDRDREITWNVTIVNADDVWALGYTGDGALVAVIDTGVNYDHVDLQDHMWGGLFYPNHGYDFANNDNNPMDDHGHGTHCAGTVAGDGTAGSQTGMAPDAKIMALKVLDSGGSGAESDCWEAIQFCVDMNVDVMSFSLGWLHAWGPDRSSWRDAMNNALFAGVIASIAAGNEGGDQGSYPIPDNVRTPGDIPPPWLHPDQTLTGGISAVVCVGATNSSDNIASFSSRGPVTWESISPFNDYAYSPGMGLIRPDISAPGENIKSLAHYSNTGYESGWSGTSMATPCVAGVIALMLSKDNSLTPEQINQTLEETALDLGSNGKDNTYGSGRVDALEAVNAIFTEPIPPYPPYNPNPADGQGFVNVGSNLSWSNGGGATSYLVFIGTDNPPTNIVNGDLSSSSSYMLSGLDFSTHYFWNIIAMNDYGETVGPVWDFTTVGPPDEDFESGDFSQNDWAFGGNADWIIDSSNPYNGTYSAQSGDIDHSETSQLIITLDVIYDGNIDFNYRVASEYSPTGTNFYDGLVFYIDDQQMGQYQPTTDGGTPWVFASFPVTVGPHTFKWSFEKDEGPGSTDMEEDCTWLDDITFPPTEEPSSDITVEYLSDWNIVGLPMEVSDAGFESLFPDAIENTLFSFGVNGYIPETELTMGTGYWLRFSNENMTTISGSYVENLTISLQENWNLISGISADFALDNILDPDNLIIPLTSFGFGGNGYFAVETLEPGHGYWVRSYGAGEITISSLAREKSRQIIENRVSEANVIAFNGFPLYFGVDIPESEILSYSLPPKPPAGVFDVRFTGGWRVVENEGRIEYFNPQSDLSVHYQVNDNERWILIGDDGNEYKLTGNGDFMIPDQSGTFSLKKSSISPDQYLLSQNFPNPFNPVTTITYELPQESYISLEVYNMNGQQVTSLASKGQEAGKYTVQWDGTDLNGHKVSSGIYLYKLETPDFTNIRKMVLMK
jgi:serine protease AprX